MECRKRVFSTFCGEQHRWVQPPDAEDRTSGGVGGVTGAIPLPRPDPDCEVLLPVPGSAGVLAGINPTT